MRRLFHSPLFHCIKIKPPTDIIVTTKVIQKCILLWQTANYIHLFLQKPDVSCRNTIPGRRHCCHIIEHMTFRFFNCTKVRHHLFRLHNHFAKKYHAWADNFRNHTHHSYNCMYFFQITTACSKFFPDIRNCIDTDNIHSLIRKKKEVIHHLIKYSWITIIQIPLIWIKRRKHIMSDFRKPCKVSRCCCRKDLWNGFFISCRNITVIIEEITAHVLSFTCSGTFCPLMFLRSMIHHEIHAYIHTIFMTFFCQSGKIFHCTEIRSYFPKICHGISAV